MANLLFTDREDMRRQWGDIVKDRKLVELAWHIRDTLKALSDKAYDNDKMTKADRDALNANVDTIHS